MEDHDMSIDDEATDSDETADPAEPKNPNAIETKPPAFPDPSDAPIPEWVRVPNDFRIPRTKQVFYIRFRAGMTDKPNKGERQCIIWSNNLGDQKLAIGRADRDPNKMSEQMAKQMVRAIDGVPADWTGEPGKGNIDVWWDEIGPKCRSILDRLFIQLHVANPDEVKDFFENCVAVRGVGG
jgi:hypothetical protein